MFAKSCAAPKRRMKKSMHSIGFPEMHSFNSPPPPPMFGSAAPASHAYAFSASAASAPQAYAFSAPPPPGPPGPPPSGLFGGPPQPGSALFGRSRQCAGPPPPPPTGGFLMSARMSKSCDSEGSFGALDYGDSSDESRCSAAGLSLDEVAKAEGSRINDSEDIDVTDLSDNAATQIVAALTNHRQIINLQDPSGFWSGQIRFPGEADGEEVLGKISKNLAPGRGNFDQVKSTIYCLVLLICKFSDKLIEWKLAASKAVAWVRKNGELLDGKVFDADFLVERCLSGSLAEGVDYDVLDELF